MGRWPCVKQRIGGFKSVPPFYSCRWYYEFVVAPRFTCLQVVCWFMLSSLVRCTVVVRCLTVQGCSVHFRIGQCPDLPMMWFVHHGSCHLNNYISRRTPRTKQEVTKGICVVGWVQLDNQTQEPVAPVVVAPTMVEHPQATLQMSFIRNHAKSHSHLNHFEVRMAAPYLCKKYFRRSNKLATHHVRLWKLVRFKGTERWTWLGVGGRNYPISGI